MRKIRPLTCNGLKNVEWGSTDISKDDPDGDQYASQGGLVCIELHIRNLSKCNSIQNTGIKRQKKSRSIDRDSAIQSLILLFLYCVYYRLESFRVVER